MKKVIAIAHKGSKSYIKHTLACTLTEKVEEAVVFEKEEDLDMALEVLAMWLEEQGSAVKDWKAIGEDI